jgi:DNA-binding beta-propeller fold protein YncE
VALDEQSGRAFVLDHQTSTVRVLDAATGTPLHAIAARAYPSLVALDARRGHVFVAAWADDAVRMLDAATGIVRRMVALGQGPGPGGMALDARTGRLFVTNYGRGRRACWTRRAAGCCARSVWYVISYATGSAWASSPSPQ